MTRQNNAETAVKLANSIRGHYIIGQALDIAIQKLEGVPEPHREDSNIADMVLLRDELFPMAYQARMITEGKEA